MSQEAPATLRNQVLADPALVGQTVTLHVLANGRIDGFLKGRVTLQSAEARQQHLAGATAPGAGDAGRRHAGLAFNPAFLTAPDASDLRPEAAGLGVAILGSAYMMLVVLLLALPIGVAASIYLEEFAPKNRWTDLIEVNISNLAAVPSIVYGILGLAIFINFRTAAVGPHRRRAGADADDPAAHHHRHPRRAEGGAAVDPRCRAWRRRQPDAGGVPPRPAAGHAGHPDRHHHRPGAGAWRNRAASADRHGRLRRTTPRPARGLFDPASALPVQVYNWTTRGDPAFVERASGAIIVLLVFLIVMNAAAILLRRRFERRW
jgi:phosphate transport system permease protein